jgi:Family of unknown function (DUF6062)
MPNAQTAYELRLACHKSGCPVCSLVQRAGARYIEGTLSESMLDPDIRHKLVDSLGFCYEHTWLSINLKLSDALGHAMLCQDLISTSLRNIQENEINPGAQLAAALDPVLDCPVCQIEQGALERIIDSLVTLIHDRNFLAEYRQSDGLCFPHLKRLLPNLDKKQQAVILDLQCTCLENLNGELLEFIRKSDYRFRDEVIGKEGDSYKRAADMITGKHRPADKKDLR